MPDPTPSAASSTAERPVLLAVDDDPAVLRAVRSDLRQRYRDRYRIVAAGGGPEALDSVRELKRRGVPLALVLSDQRMPQLSGVELLREVRDLVPDTRTVLLTAYADTHAAISAINDVGLDHYILKPWDPPEERLYPVLDDVLLDWASTHHPAAPRLTLVGTRWSPDAHRLRDYLSRTRVPFRWRDPDGSAEARRLLAAVDDPRLPLVVMPDGEVLRQPDTATLGGHLGLHTRAQTDVYDLAIVGAGPAGLAAAVYGASEGLSTVVVEAEAPGGQAGQSSRIENYLGFPSGIAGGELSSRAVMQAKRFGAEFLTPATVAGLRVDDSYRVLLLDNGSEVTARAVVLAPGVAYRTLDVPGCAELTGRGVYYGAAQTEAGWLHGERIVVVGGANSAGQAAMYFSRVADCVTLLVRGDSLAKRMSHYLVEQIERTGAIDVRLGAEVERVHGTDRLERVTVRADGATTDIDAAGMFVFIGAQPHTAWLDGVVARDDRGFVLAGRDARRHDTGRGANDRIVDPDGTERDPALFETSVPGVYAVGDVRAGSVKRVASAVGQGSVAVQLVHEYLGST